MRSIKTIHVISAHAEGEVGDVIVGGVGKVGNVDVNPFVYSLNVGYRF